MAFWRPQLQCQIAKTVLSLAPTWHKQSPGVSWVNSARDLPCSGEEWATLSDLSPTTWTCDLWLFCSNYLGRAQTWGGWRSIFHKLNSLCEVIKIINISAWIIVSAWIFCNVGYDGISWHHVYHWAFCNFAEVERSNGILDQPADRCGQRGRPNQFKWFIYFHFAHK